MNYLTKYYKNLCEKLQEEVTKLEEQLHASKDSPARSNLAVISGGKMKGMQPKSAKPAGEVKPTYPEPEENEEKVTEE